MGVRWPLRFSSRGARVGASLGICSPPDMALERTRRPASLGRSLRLLGSPLSALPLGL